MSIARSVKKKLFTAIEGGRISEVELILARHPDALSARGEHNKFCRDKTPLMYALQCRSFATARMLIHKGADANARMPEEGFSVIQLAVRFFEYRRQLNASLRTVEALLDAGANPTEALGAALSGYHIATDRPELIELLLRKGADPNAPNGGSGSSHVEMVALNAHRYSDHVMNLFGLTREG